MDVTVHIPDDLVCRMTEAGGDLSRRALEGLALEEYKGGVSPAPISAGCLVSEPDISWTVS
jgi:hypothetical protein